MSFGDDTLDPTKTYDDGVREGRAEVKAEIAALQAERDKLWEWLSQEVHVNPAWSQEQRKALQSVLFRLSATDPGHSRSQAKRLTAQGKPPETSVELAEQVMECRTWTKGIGLVDQVTDAAALINAYVLERETQITKLIKKWRNSCERIALGLTISDEDVESVADCADELESALARARASQRSPKEKPR